MYEMEHHPQINIACYCAVTFSLIWCSKPCGRDHGTSEESGAALNELHSAPRLRAEPLRPRCSWLAGLRLPQWERYLPN